MARDFIRFLATVACAALAACASSQTPTTPSQSSPWTLTFHLTGGFAGFDRQLDLSSSGAATVVDRRRQVTRKAQVTGDELMAIASLVSDARTAQVITPGCADCFEYDLDLLRSQSHVTITANDAGLTGSDAAPLLRKLSELLNRLAK